MGEKVRRGSEGQPVDDMNKIDIAARKWNKKHG